MPKKRTSLLIDSSLLQRARAAYAASTNTEAVRRALEDAVQNKEIEASLRSLVRGGKGRVVDVYGSRS